MTDDTTDPLTDAVAEQHLIGALLRHPGQIPEALSVVPAEAFTTDLGSCSMSALASTIGAATTPSDCQSTVRKELVTTYRQRQPDVMIWLHDAVTTAPLTVDGIPPLTSRIADLHSRRLIRAHLAKAATINTDSASTTVDAVGEIELLLSEVRAGTSIGDSIVEGPDALAAALTTISQRAAGEGPGTLTTGSGDLDDALGGGYERGRLYIAGGRPGSGKSVLGTDSARGALAAGAGVVLITMEMSASEVLTRMISAEGRINNRALRSGKLDPSQEQSLAAVTDALPWDNLVIIDKSGLTVETITSLVTHQVARLRGNGLEEVLVVIDYVQIMGTSQVGGRNSTRQVELGHISRGLKQLSRDVDVPVLALSQVGRGGENTPPRMSDLREAGDLEQDSDSVILLHSPSSIDPEDRPGETDFIIAKNRAGAANVTVQLTSQFHYYRFHDMAAA